MIQAAKIIGKGLATTGLIGTLWALGVLYIGLGVVFLIFIFLLFSYLMDKDPFLPFYIKKTS